MHISSMHILKLYAYFETHQIVHVNRVRFLYVGCTSVRWRKLTNTKLDKPIVKLRWKGKEPSPAMTGGDSCPNRY